VGPGRKGPAGGPHQITRLPFGAVKGRLTPMNGSLYFVANNGTGDELWKYDPRNDAYGIVKDLIRAPTSSTPDNLTVVNGTLYFAAPTGTTDGSSGRAMGPHATRHGDGPQPGAPF